LILLVTVITAVAATWRQDREVRRDLEHKAASRVRFGSPFEFPGNVRPRWLTALEAPVERLDRIAPFFLLPATLGSAATVLRSPSKLTRRMLRSPGAVALVVGSFTAGLALVELLVDWPIVPARPLGDRVILLLFFGVSIPIGASILGAWIIMAVSGRWRCRRDWRDRLGRALGFGWLGYLSLPTLQSALWG
jgi:hypothetical protein